MHRADPRHILVLALVAAAAAAALVVPKGERSAGPPVPSGPASWRGLVGSRPQAAVADKVIVVLRTPSLAQRVAAAGGSADIERERRWTNVAMSAQRLLLARLALHGVVVHPIYKSNDHFSIALRQGGLDMSSTFVPRIWRKAERSLRYEANRIGGGNDVVRGDGRAGDAVRRERGALHERH